MDVLTAILMLTGMPGTPEPCPSEADFPAVRKAVHQVAIQWELLDEREVSYVFATRNEFEADLNMLRRRYHTFRDMPRLEEAHRLPERKVVNDLIQFNRAYRRHLVEKQVLEQDRYELYEEVMIETDRLYKVWDAVRDARCDFYFVGARRQALQRLKDLIGEADYNAMILPPNVPVWRWNER